MKNIIITIKSIFIVLLLSVYSCSDYLDVVPDNVATVDIAFNQRYSAEQYLFTCYSYMPSHGGINDNPALVGGDEMLGRINNRYESYTFLNISRGFQNVVDPYGDQWSNLYKGLRDCNIFLENVESVPDLEYIEKIQWIAEVKFLKAYYHYYLMKMYGPIPLVKTNIAIDAGTEEVKVTRNTIDECFNYVVQLLDEAETDLPLVITDPAAELGRITKPIALALKAKVLVTAASPLFNGDNDFAQLENKDGTPLFNATYDETKWDTAVAACKAAIDACAAAGFELYTYTPSLTQVDLSSTIITQLSIRNALTERWNSEIIWANTQSSSSRLQQLAQPTNLDPQNPDTQAVYGTLGAPLKMAELFYSDNGVPINEDKTWSYNNKYDLQNGREEDHLLIKSGYKTAKLNFNREPRFYADMAFDGGIWYGQGYYDDKKVDELLCVQSKNGQLNSVNLSRGSSTGYFIKKLIHYQNTLNGGGGSASYSLRNYPWPVIRLADLYLTYAEAINESTGPSEEAYHYLNLVRERAGLGTVQSAWTQYSTNPSKFESQTGLRDIIHQERLIEMAFEGQRFWDLRRWKKAAEEMNEPVTGWNVWQQSAENYYVPTIVWDQKFGLKDYFWPIKDSYIEQNPNLVQNLGW
ncbi:RagB/SusD family nutrient uptake outer membrane protein [Algibacter miyuki]|uniref:RagB/SusD family nutrient uptake outer membrane protein n=1 Tax=Algibacter miyuki TaxID=1306933 RepID=A0ABV5GW22_9FLAO|nr:RagB/SusD family nutrient uptake outer membrane protein [Algibacter miyuki]MDN3665162.1 RagB/SusD family nutrient uptake outer membrane protein [Algibacter miyuki]